MHGSFGFGRGTRLCVVSVALVLGTVGSATAQLGNQLANSTASTCTSNDADGACSFSIQNPP